jgi:hypothetical protein
MAARFVLIHSPSVGPRTWQPVAHRLTELGWEAIVPSLLHVTDQGPPYWPRVVDAVRAGLGTAEQGQGLVLAAHSNAGLFIPVITAALPGQVLGSIFVDAAVPPASGAALVAPPELLALLRDKASDGLLPRWTDWWEEEEVAPLFPDQAIRPAVTEEQPRLPLPYYEASVPVPAGWDAQPCAYLLFGPPYDELASEARGRGWIVAQLPGRHLHQLVDPDGVARSLLAIGDQMGVTKPQPVTQWSCRPWSGAAAESGPSPRGRAGAAHHRNTTDNSGERRSAGRAGQQPFPSVRPGRPITRIVSRTDEVARVPVRHDSDRAEDDPERPPKPRTTVVPGPSGEARG